MKKVFRDLGLEVCGLKVREAEGEGEESRVIEGHAAVFGVRSVNLVPWSSYREIYEVMEKGCISDDLLKRSDIVLTAFHNNEKILGRAVNGQGTLELKVDEKGLAIRCEIAKTQTGDEILELVRRGDVTGMSFAYVTDEEDTENCVSYEKIAERGKDGKEVWIRHVKRVDGLYDVTIAGHPAYKETDVQAREASDIESRLPEIREEKEKKSGPDVKVLSEIMSLGV